MSVHVGACCDRRLGTALSVSVHGAMCCRKRHHLHKCEAVFIYCGSCGTGEQCAVISLLVIRWSSVVVFFFHRCWSMRAFLSVVMWA